MSLKLSISAVFKILPATIEEIGTGNSLLILQKLAEECGYQIQIGDQRIKFILDATILIPKISSDAEYNQIMSNGASEDIAIEDHLAKWRQGEQHDFVDILYAYAISTNKYKQYLAAK